MNNLILSNRLQQFSSRIKGCPFCQTSKYLCWAINRGERLKLTPRKEPLNWWKTVFGSVKAPSLEAGNPGFSLSSSQVYCEGKEMQINFLQSFRRNTLQITFAYYYCSRKFPHYQATFSLFKHKCSQIYYFMAFIRRLHVSPHSVVWFLEARFNKQSTRSACIVVLQTTRPPKH